MREQIFNRQKTSEEKLALAKAQLLAKIGRWDEAKALFDKAIEENYDKAATISLECLPAIGKKQGTRHRGIHLK